MKRIMNLLFKTAICAVAVVPMLSSCFNADEMWDKIDKIEHRLDSLENSLNQQFDALNSLLDGKTISSCEKNSDGSYDVTLSNGTKFTVLADGTDYSSLVSVKVVNGVKYWATYDADGNLVVINDAEGNPVPVVRRTKVKVVVEDGFYYLEIDGQKYKTGYDTEALVQVFSSCETLKDATGNVYAMKFTFGEGVTVTVAVDGYNGVLFRQPNAAGTSMVINDYYISYGYTSSVLLDKAGVIDYVMQIPDGWRVEERVDEYTEETYLDITAPSKAAVAAGAAVAKGDLKIVAVVEGGKAAVSKLVVSAEPFKVFNISGSKAIVEPYEGVQKYVYGIVAYNDFDEASILAKVDELLQTTGDIPAGYNVAEDGISKSHTETFGTELDPEGDYLFWAVPALYAEGEDAGFYVKEGLFTTFRITPVSVKISEPAASLLDAKVSIKIEGTDKVYAGTSVKADDLFDNILYQINNGIIEPVKAAASYEGAASAYPTAEANQEVDFLPGTTYVTWVIPVEDGKETYQESDVVYKEFTTTSVTAGGSLKVSLGEAEVTQTTVSIPVEAEGAELIYYAYFSSDRYLSTDNDSKVKLILDQEGHTTVKGSETDAVIDRVKPNSSRWLMAVAVDKDGKYGEVATMAAKTLAVEYNSLTLTVSADDITDDSARIKVDVEGGTATEFIYWVGKVKDNFWANSSYLGATRQNAQQYMACYPEDENIVRCMSKYGEIGEDGILDIYELSMTTDYVIMVLAKDESGLYSKGGYKMITTLAADLGTVVRTGTDEWNAAKELVEIDWIEEKFEKAENSFLNSSYSYKFSCPKDMTAFVVSLSEDYYKGNPNFITMEDVIIDIENFASKYTEMGSTPSYLDENGTVQLISEPDWYDDEGNVHGGFLLNIYKFNVHGYPEGGYVAYFAEGTHAGKGCNAWDKAAEKCSNYQRAADRLANLCSLEYWTEHMREFRNVTNEEYIKKNGQTYYEAYYEYYKDATPRLFINDGNGVEITQPYAMGPDDKGHIADAVIVVLRDSEGNYFEPMYFPVPDYFTK